MSLFEEVRETADNAAVLVDAIGCLIKKRQYFKGNCPFLVHKKDGTLGQFVFSIKKKIFYCFDCHSGGDIISFYSKMFDKSPLDSANEIKEKYCSKWWLDK